MKKLLVLAALMATAGVARADYCNQFIDDHGFAGTNEKVSCPGTNCFTFIHNMVTTGQESHSVKIWDSTPPGTNDAPYPTNFCDTNQGPPDGSHRQAQLDCWGIADNSHVVNVRREAQMVFKSGAFVIQDEKDLVRFSANDLRFASVALTIDGAATFATLHGQAGKTITWTCRYRFGDHQLQ